jgi:hypothetical protein
MMPPRIRVATLLAATLMAVACSRGVPAGRDSTATPAAPSDTILAATPSGLGKLRVGMTVAEASRAAGTLVPSRVSETGCQFAQWPSGPAGVRVMLENDTITRIDVAKPNVPTSLGARVGDNEAKVLALYVDHVSVTRQKYTDGHVLTVTPGAPADSIYRLIFETDSGRVARYRLGRRPWVEYVEGCG